MGSSVHRNRRNRKHLPCSIHRRLQPLARHGEQTRGEREEEDGAGGEGRWRAGTVAGAARKFTTGCKEVYNKHHILSLKACDSYESPSLPVPPALPALLKEERRGQHPGTHELAGVQSDGPVPLRQEQEQEEQEEQEEEQKQEEQEEQEGEEQEEEQEQQEQEEQEEQEQQQQQEQQEQQEQQQQQQEQEQEEQEQEEQEQEQEQIHSNISSLVYAPAPQ